MTFEHKTQKAALNKKADFASFRFKTLNFKMRHEANYSLTRLSVRGPNRRRGVRAFEPAAAYINYGFSISDERGREGVGVKRSTLNRIGDDEKIRF